MELERRRLLRQIAGLGAGAAIAGCVGVQESEQNTDNGGSGDGSDGENGGDGSTPTATATAAAEATETPQGTDSGTPTGETDQYSLVEPDMAEGITGSVWHARNKASTQKFDTTVEGFNGDYNPNVDSSKIADLRKKTTTAIPSGRGPHVFEWVHDWGGEYWNRGFLSDQSDNLRVSKDMFTGAGQRAMQFDGKVIGLPRSAECPSLIYNTDIVDEPPETLEEMKAIMEEYHDPSSGQYGLSHPVNTYFISGWVQAFGGTIYDGESDSLGHTDEETLKGFRLVKEDLWPYMPKDPKYGPQAAAFSSGSAAFAVNGPWFLSTLDEKGVNYEVATFPSPESGTARPYTGVKMFYFTKRMDEEPEKGKAARQYAEWYVSNEDKLESLAQSQGFIPVHKDVVEKGDLPSHVKAFAQQVNDGTPMPSTPHMNAVWAPTKNNFLTYLQGNAELESAMQSAEKKIKSSWNS